MSLSCRHIIYAKSNYLFVLLSSHHILDHTTSTMAEEQKVVTASAEDAVVVKQSGDANQDVNIMRLITEGKNPRGIPTAKFIVSIRLPFVIKARFTV